MDSIILEKNLKGKVGKTDLKVGESLILRGGPGFPSKARRKELKLPKVIPIIKEKTAKGNSGLEGKCTRAWVLGFHKPRHLCHDGLKEHGHREAHQKEVQEEASSKPLPKAEHNWWNMGR